MTFPATHSGVSMGVLHGWVTVSCHTANAAGAAGAAGGLEFDGVNRPSRDCLPQRPWWVCPIQIATAMRSCSWVAQKRRSATLFSSRLTGDRIAALSAHGVTLPIAADHPAAGKSAKELPASKLRSSIAVNCAASSITPHQDRGLSRIGGRTSFWSGSTSRRSRFENPSPTAQG